MFDTKTILRLTAAASALAAGCLASGQALAAVDVLNFAGLDGAAQEQVLDYYNGGAGGLGSTGGPNYGISFGADTISCTDHAHGGCNTAEIPGGPGANAVFFLTGPGDIMNVAAGFTTGFSFFYSAISAPGTVTVYDGLNGTGNLLATLDLSLTPTAGDPGCDAQPFCPYSAAGVTFAGTAESVSFSGTANLIGFADITLGTSVAGGGPTAVPEPQNLALMLAGLGLLGAAANQRQKRR
jgi:hypothetical protein